MSVMAGRLTAGHRWVWFGATAATAFTLLGLGRVATSRPDVRIARLSAEALATWRPSGTASVISVDAESFAVSGGTDVVVLRHGLLFASVDAARDALGQARCAALSDGWEPCEEGCGWQKPAVDADLGLHVDGPRLVIALRAYRRTGFIRR